MKRATDWIVIGLLLAMVGLRLWEWSQRHERWYAPTDAYYGDRQGQLEI